MINFSLIDQLSHYLGIASSLVDRMKFVYKPNCFAKEVKNSKKDKIISKNVKINLIVPVHVI